MCRLLKKGRREIEEIRDEREGQAKMSNRYESEEREEIETFSLCSYLLQG